MDQRNEILNSLDSLEVLRHQLEHRLDKVEDAKLYIPQEEGKWSIIQVLSHLVYIEKGIVQYINKKMLGRASLKKKNIIASLRFRLLKRLLDSSARFKMPKILGEPSNEKTIEELKGEFVQSRIVLKKLVLDFPEEEFDKLIFKHPFAGRFSMQQTIDFIYDHYNHHIRQIERILKVVDKGN